MRRKSVVDTDHDRALYTAPMPQPEIRGYVPVAVLTAEQEALRSVTRSLRAREARALQAARRAHRLAASAVVLASLVLIATFSVLSFSAGRLDHAVNTCISPRAAEEMVSTMDKLVKTNRSCIELHESNRGFYETALVREASRQDQFLQCVSHMPRAKGYLAAYLNP